MVLMATATDTSAEGAWSVAPMTSPVAITQNRSQLASWLLALEVRGIPAQVRVAEAGVVVHVPWTDADAARTELAGVEDDERETHRRTAADAARRHVHHRYAIAGGIVFALALLAMFLVTGPSAARSAWFAAGSSDAARVLAGEWWRTVTALTLHSDSNHVLSNMALGAIVITFVMRRAGVGFGAGLVVIAGTAGNLVNAWGYGVHHNSIGFSTAVFGAIGILGGFTFVESVRARGRRPAWVAIAGSLGLLAMFGASEQSDMLAHLFGLFAGLVVGLVVATARSVPRTWIGQLVAGALTVAFVAGAWVVALA
jgi:rhomboid protease GluP